MVTQVARPATVLDPVPASERIDVIDALRGFALAGVLYSNLFVFSGFMMLSEEQLIALPGGAANGIVATLSNVFVSRKFITIFSLLFGLGFGIQLARARARGEDVVPTYTRRLLVLLVIGLVHKFMLWGGDILTLYAVLGFALARWNGCGAHSPTAGSSRCVALSQARGDSRVITRSGETE